MEKKSTSFSTPPKISEEEFVERALFIFTKRNGKKEKKARREKKREKSIRLEMLL